MAKISEKIKCCIISISFQERKKRELERYRQRIAELEKMETDEIELEYINRKSGYEHKKNVLSAFMVAIVVSVLMDAWSSFYKFMEKVMQYATSLQGDGVLVTQVSFVVSTIAIVFITIIIFIILVMHTREMHRIYKDLLIIEKVKKYRD